MHAARPVALSAFQDTDRPHLRTVALLGAALIAPFLVAGLVTGAPPLVTAARVFWIASLLTATVLLRPGSRVAPAWAEALAAAASTVATIVIVWETGGAASGYFPVLMALPFCVAVLAPDATAWSAVAGVATSAAGAAMLLASPVPRLDALRWTATAAGLGVIATVATRLSRSLVAQRLDAEQARAELAERLAEHARSLAEAQQLAIAGRLAAGVAHEVNNPLAYLKANLAFFGERLAELGAGGDAQLEEALHESALGIDRIARIMGDLRDASRRPPALPCRAPIAEVVAEARRVASLRTASAAVRVALAEDVPDARMCRGRLVQVLVNLLVNAADALADVRDAPWIALSAEPRDGGILLAVEDGGPGFPPEVLPRALEPFVTTKGHGVGLGLALSRDYVAAAGGRILATNVPAGGARVELWLHAAEQLDEPRCLLCEYRPGEQAPLDAAGLTLLTPPRRRGAA